MRRFIIPAFVVLLGTGGAFASKAVTSKKVMVDGYHIDAASGQCITDGQQCSSEGNVPCLWEEDGSTQLKDVPTNPTTCGAKLFRQ